MKKSSIVIAVVLASALVASATDFEKYETFLGYSFVRFSPNSGCNNAAVCGLDFPFAEGFGPDIKLARTQTIMQGASHCDFRYRRQRDR